MQIVEYIWPMGVWKTYELKTLVSNSWKYYPESFEWKSKLWYFLHLIIFIWYTIKNIYKVMRVLKYSTSIRHVDKSLSIIYRCYLHRQNIHSGEKYKYETIYFCEWPYHRYLSLIAKRYIRYNEEVIQIINDIYYKHYDIKFTYKDKDLSDIIILRTQRDLTIDRKNKEVLEEETLLYRKYYKISLCKIQ